MLGIHRRSAEEEIVPHKDQMVLYSLDKEKMYFLTIIDFLTHYDFKKKAEYLVFGTIYGDSISAIPPKKYADRFYKFISEAIS